ncbi:MAG: multiheme c-type cytochrome, partial [Acidobacteriota bacterium]
RAMAPAGTIRAVSGVSCESCHGAGRDYLDIHNDYGGKDVDHRTESAEHRAQRLAASVAAGLRRPSNLYAVASSCYGCHTVPNEKLVNVGRHSVGSADFDLVERLGGEVKHNVLDSFLNGDGTVNADRPPEHQRRLAVMSRALAVEHSLRGLAAATENGVYLKAMQRRLRGAVTELRSIGQAADLPEIEAMVQAVKAVPSRLGHRDAQLAAADQVAEQAKRFLDRHDGTRLPALDPLVRGEELPSVDDEEDLDDEIRIADDGVADGAVTDGAVADGTIPATGTLTAGSTATAGATSGARPAATTGAVAAIPAQGEKRSHLRPRPRHDTLEAAACQKCHGDQNAWWFDDRHYTSIEPFLDRAPAAARIARLYGISPSRMARGDSLCMDCHGTFATGRERREVQDGVSCQSCHGAAADYIEVHQEGDKSLGASRPGFVKALAAGMKNLHELDTALTNCASCHYVTDPRLLSAGHPSGVDFDIAAGFAQVRHWSAPVPSTAAMQTAWSGILRRRGAVPEVRLARLASAGTTTPAGVATGSTAGSTADVTNTGRRVDPLASDRFRPTDRRPRPVDRRPLGRTANDETIDVPPPPEVGEDASIEDILLAIGQQLERLYRAVAGKPEPRGPNP